MKSTAYKEKSTAYKEKSTAYNVKSTAYKEKSTAYNVKSTAYNVKSTAYNVKSTAYNVKSTAYNVKSTAYNAKAYNVRKSYHLRQLRHSIIQRNGAGVRRKSGISVYGIMFVYYRTAAGFSFHHQKFVLRRIR